MELVFRLPKELSTCAAHAISDRHHPRYDLQTEGEKQKFLLEMMTGSQKCPRPGKINFPRHAHVKARSTEYIIHRLKRADTHPCTRGGMLSIKNTGSNHMKKKQMPQTFACQKSHAGLRASITNPTTIAQLRPCPTNCEGGCTLLRPDQPHVRPLNSKPEVDNHMGANSGPRAPEKKPKDRKQRLPNLILPQRYMDTCFFHARNSDNKNNCTEIKKTNHQKNITSPTW